MMMMMGMTFFGKRIASICSTGCNTSKSVKAHWVLKNKIRDCYGDDDGNGDYDGGQSSLGPFPVQWLRFVSRT